MDSIVCNTLSLVSCATVSNGEIGFCHCNTCLENEGDCNSNSDCHTSILQDCLNNCSAPHDFDSELDCQMGWDGGLSWDRIGTYTKDDCIYEVKDKYPTAIGITISENCPSTCSCYANMPGYDDYSSSGYQSCIFSDTLNDFFHCKNLCHGLICGTNNCPVSLGFDSEVDCCTSTLIMSPNYPFPPPSNTYEIWLLTAPGTGSFVTLQFHSFHVRLIVETKSRYSEFRILL